MSFVLGNQFIFFWEDHMVKISIVQKIKINYLKKRENSETRKLGKKHQ